MYTPSTFYMKSAVPNYEEKPVGGLQYKVLQLVVSQEANQTQEFVNIVNILNVTPLNSP